MNNIIFYIRKCRIDHFIKHVFILPGIILALILGENNTINHLNICLGLFSSFLIASSNYVLNDFLDREFDKFHPLKKKRELDSKKLNEKKIIIFYSLLVFLSLVLAHQVNKYFFYIICLFSISGILYNVKLFRLKDKVYIDVISEAWNNPIRLYLGWFLIKDNLELMPPISFVLFYFFAGGFLMSAKRLAEIKYFKRYGQKNKIIKYRKSYSVYNENNLTIACIVYLMLSAFNITTFLLKYRAELILLYPFIVLLFSYYFYITLTQNDKAISPEKIYLNTKLIILVLLCLLIFCFLTFTDLPIIKWIVYKTIFIN